MTGRQHADMRGICRNRRAERLLDIATAVFVGVMLAAGFFVGWSA